VSAALALVPLSTDLSPARAALVAAFAERESVAKAQETIAQARERLSTAIAARTEAKGALNALATLEAERVTAWSIDGKGPEPKPDLDKRRELQRAVDDACARADAAGTGLAKMKAAADEGERRMQAAEHAVSLALSAVLMEEVEAEFEDCRQFFDRARAKVRALVKLAGTAQNVCAAAHQPRAGSLAYQATTLLSPAPEQWQDLGDWSAATRAIAHLTSDLRTEPTATLNLD